MEASTVVLILFFLNNRAATVPFVWSSGVVPQAARVYHGHLLRALQTNRTATISMSPTPTISTW